MSVGTRDQQLQRQAIIGEFRRRAMGVKALAELKQQERAMWASGDYAAIAREMFWDVGARIVERANVSPGDRVLDVACGPGNAAIRAAQAGGRVVGVDLTPELFVAARALATEAGVDVQWVEGDAEALPFEDASFDVVLSTFGCMFAPRHELAAQELARVLAPSGRLGICSWTPQSSIAELMRTLFAHLPPASDSGPPPPLWGSEEHVRDLFNSTAIDLRFSHRSIDFQFDSVDRALEIYETAWGPFVEAKAQLEPQGRWEALRADLAEVLERNNTSGGPELTYSGEYLEVLGSATR